MSLHQDANLILKLYELRGEDRMRRARDWFSMHFKITTSAEFDQLCPLGSQENASFRQVASYWEMVGSFLNSSVLSPDLFYKSGNELLFTWLRISQALPVLRERARDHTYLAELEHAGNAMIEWRKGRSAEGFEAFRLRVLGH